MPDIACGVPPPIRWLLLHQMGSEPDMFRLRRRARAPRAAFTLIEALVASVIVAMVALAASTSVAVGIAVEEDNRRAVLATQVADAPPVRPRPQTQDQLLGLFSSDSVGRDVVVQPATLADMMGSELVVKPSLEVIYDAA